MLYKNKVTLFSIFILLGVSYFGYRYYRHTHPRYIRPPPARAEVEVTIIPGWNLRQVAEYLVSKGFASTTNDVYRFTGQPAKVYALNEMVNFDDTWWHVYPLNVGAHLERPDTVSFDGYLAPETVRVFADAKLEDVLKKFVVLRDDQITSGMGIAAENERLTLHQILTMASLLEKEARTLEDRKIVSDILWRRNKMHWALQLDSTVHYVVDRMGDVFTTAKERQIDSYWNTYKYPGLPPGPICNPSLEAIDAALYPEKNDYWYFLTGSDGKMYYAKNLDEHNRNRAKYLK